MHISEKELPLPRKEAPDYIETKWGKAARVEKQTLAKLAVIGGGPEFIKDGRRVGYLPSMIDKWVLSRRRQAKNTSDGGTNAA